MHHGRFIDRIQAAINAERGVSPERDFASVLHALSEHANYFELLVLKDLAVRRLAQASRCAVCSNCGVLPVLLDILTARADSPAMSGAIQEAARACCEKNGASTPPHPAVAKTLRLIATQYANPQLSLAEAARVAGVSRWYLERLLIRDTSVGFLKHVHRARNWGGAPTRDRSRAKHQRNRMSSRVPKHEPARSSFQGGVRPNADELSSGA